MQERSAVEVHAEWTSGRMAIVDVREAEEVAATRVPGVPVIPMSELVGRLDELPAGPLAVMCRSGARSARVVEYLEGSGHPNAVVNLEGGIIAWIASGLPYEGESPWRGV